MKSFFVQLFWINSRLITGGGKDRHPECKEEVCMENLIKKAQKGKREAFIQRRTWYVSVV